MIAFIDESGDEGTQGKGTRWLTFGAFCLPDGPKDIERAMVNVAEMRLAQRRLIHFTKLDHADKKGILHLWSGMGFVSWNALMIASDTTDVRAGSLLRRSDYQYNYALRVLVERISRYAQYIDEPVEIIIEKRRNFDLGGFQDYLRLLERRKEPRIDWTRIRPEKVSVSTRREHKGLCVADGLAHAAFKALEPHARWHHCETGYLDEVRPRIWRGPKDTQAWDYGFLTLPWGQQPRHRMEYPWMREL